MSNSCPRVFQTLANGNSKNEIRQRNEADVSNEEKEVLTAYTIARAYRPPGSLRLDAVDELPK